MERRRAESGVPCFYGLIRVGTRSKCFLYDGAVTNPHSGSQGLLKVGIGGDMKYEVVAEQAARVLHLQEMHANGR